MCTCTYLVVHWIKGCISYNLLFNFIQPLWISLYYTFSNIITCRETTCKKPVKGVSIGRSMRAKSHEIKIYKSVTRSCFIELVLLSLPLLAHCFFVVLVLYMYSDWLLVTCYKSIFCTCSIKVLKWMRTHLKSYKYWVSCGSSEYN